MANERGPVTLAYGLSDSPAGLAAWILDKLRDWTECDGDLRNRFSFDQRRAVVNLYSAHRHVGTSFRFCREWGWVRSSPTCRRAGTSGH
jgi:epoxide hydrolase